MKTPEQYASELVRVTESKRPNFVAGGGVMYRVEIGEGERALPVGPELSDRKAIENIRSTIASVVEEKIEEVMLDLGYEVSDDGRVNDPLLTRLIGGEPSASEPSQTAMDSFRERAKRLVENLNPTEKAVLLQRFGIVVPDSLK